MSMSSAVDVVPEVASRRPAHVLVVEDSPDHRMLIVRALQSAGYGVSTAGSGEQALDRLGGPDADVDVVLIDQKLPRMSGTQLLRAVMDMPHGPAPVVVTGMGSQTLVVEALRLGAVDYVVKSPDYLAELPAVVARAHRQHDLARRYRELQRFALLVHEPTVREDTVAEIVSAAHRLLGAAGVGLSRRHDAGGWELTAQEGDLGDVAGLLAWLEARDQGTVSMVGTQVVVDLPADADEQPGALVLVPYRGLPFADEELQLAATFAAFAASALRQVRRLELERGLVDQLQQSVRARQDFTASVSHELRTPLTVITGYTETLLHRSSAVPEQLREHLLTRVLGNAGELRRLIDQLLDVASLERGHELAPVTARVDLRDVVASVVEELAFLLDGRTGARVAPSLRVSADPDLLARTLVNLVSNACKYSAPGTAVSIDVRVEGTDARVAVTDAGPGVALQDQSRVFEPFWRGSMAVAQAIRGTGIGLALVSEYVAAMGGHVGIESSPGEGATFWFTVPLAPDDVPDRAPAGTTLPDRGPVAEDG